MADGELDDEVLLTYDEAVALLPDGDRLHTFLNPAGILAGADWSRDSVLALLRDADRREVSGPAAQSFGHGLAAWREGRPVFIEAREWSP
jgi:hypothetical protein